MVGGSGGRGIGMAYGYLDNTPIATDGLWHKINYKLGAGGTYGNSALFLPADAGIQIAEIVIVRIMIWAEQDVRDPGSLLAVRLDKQHGADDPLKLLIRVPGAFLNGYACVNYQGILLPGDIIQGAALAANPFNINDGYASVIAEPISL